MKFRLWTWVLAWSVGCVPALLHAQTNVPADFVVALVNSQPITNAEVRVVMQRTAEQLAIEGQPVPPAKELRERVLERLISDRAQLDFAQATGLRVDDAAVDQAELGLARQSQLDVAGLRQRMEKDGADVATVRNQLRDQIMLSRLRERDVDSRVRITEQDIDKYIAEQLAANKDPLSQEINLAQILLAVPEKASAEQTAKILAQARELQLRAKRGESFAALVTQYSAAERSGGGEIGLRRGDRYPPLFLSAVQDLPVGAISEVVHSGAGFHILKVVERRAPSTYIRTVVQTRVRHILLRTDPTLTQAAAIAKLADFKQRIQSGKADFAALAREHSQDSSAESGGDLGWVSPGIFVPEFENAMNRLAEGQISAPLVSRFGVHLIQTLDRRRVDLSQRELRDAVREQLRISKVDEAYANWAREIRERAYVEIRDPAQ